MARDPFIVGADLAIDVPGELFAPAETATFSGAYDMGAFEFGPDSYEALGPLPFSVTLTNVGGALLVQGSISGSVRTSCSRCLEAAEYDVESDVEGYFIIEGEGEAPDDMDDDEFDVLPESNRIDLEPLLRAAVLADLPLVPVCDDDCKGLCPICGANLNEGPCGCKPREAEKEPSAPTNPFEALKNYKFE